MAHQSLGSRLVALLAGLTCSAMAQPAAGQVEEAWIVSYDGPAHYLDDIHQVHVDTDGTILVVGETTVAGFAHDLMLARYTADGNLLWMQNIDGPASGNDYAPVMALDNAGNIYIAGYGYSGSPNTRCLLAKFTPQGGVLWSESYFADGSSSNITRDMTVDNAGNVYITGWTIPQGGDGNGMTFKYDTNGNFIWERQFDGAGEFDTGDYVAVDSQGDIIVVGRVRFGEDDVIIIKYDTDGNELWSDIYAGPGGLSEEPRGLELGSDDSIYVAGRSYSPEDIFAVKYTTDGAFAWDYLYDGPASEDDSTEGITIDSADNLIISGFSKVIDTGTDAMVIKLDSDGVELWITYEHLDGSFDGGDEWVAVAVDADDNIFVTGHAERVIPGIPGLAGEGPPTEWGIWSAGYTPDGTNRWTKFKVSDGSVEAVDVGEAGRFYLGGHEWTETTETDFLIFAYDTLTDCNDNGIDDAIDIAEGTSSDCNANEIPDECDIADGVSLDCNGNTIPDECDILAGTLHDDDGSGVADECEATGDLNGDGNTGAADLAIVLGAWGPCPVKGPCPADINGDGNVGPADLAAVLGQWG